MFNYSIMDDSATLRGQRYVGGAYRRFLSRLRKEAHARTITMGMVPMWARSLPLA